MVQQSVAKITLCNPFYMYVVALIDVLSRYSCINPLCMSIEEFEVVMKLNILWLVELRYVSNT